MLGRAIVSGALLLGSGCDRVAVNNSAGEVGLFVDGQGAQSPINDLRLSQDEVGIVSFRVGNYTAASTPNRNEVIGFGEARAPTRDRTTWTPGDDSFNFGLEAPVAIDLTIWVVQGPVNVAQFRINDGLVNADATWAEERAGLEIGDVDIIDMTGGAAPPNAVLNFAGNDWAFLESEVGLADGRLNVYWIQTVDGNPARGRSNFDDKIVMGFEGVGHLLAHEIGHALSLLHPEDGGLGSQMPSTNVMAGSSTSRSYLTEGQTFRAHFDPESAVNAVLEARPGQPVEDCHPYDGSPPCPDLQRRIWADGAASPPN
ncbi:hypothetical protein [Rubrimonas cliftonensis]|uniref:Uncharacterized protein n=1 Tax=Rubrimonas cliftonensis TaxID=89524 RepID=A0A1H4GG01_9RHOB|nr:hypothetical protein [Rubrimonas cliftonensis]SEB07652.1 hypothetical protein SAMN05444370_1563 [Rubrimonas cliftonensis]